LQRHITLGVFPGDALDIDVDIGIVLPYFTDARSDER
jgi:hypothetical protein